MKYRLGHFDRHRIIDKETGETFEYVKLQSISFAAMDEIEFQRFYDRALYTLCEMAGGIEPGILQQEVLAQLAAA